MKKYKSYLVLFEGNGYFADKQYFDYWSFTNDIVKAKRYKSLKTATNRIKKATLSPVYRILNAQVIEESITFVDNEDGTRKMLTNMNVVHEHKNAQPLVTTGSTIANLVTDPHDPFWD